MRNLLIYAVSLTVTLASRLIITHWLMALRAQTEVERHMRLTCDAGLRQVSIRCSFARAACTVHDNNMNIPQTEQGDPIDIGTHSL